MRQLKDLLCWLGAVAMLVGLFFVLGACGGIEHGGDAGTGIRAALIGVALMGGGMVAIRIAIK